MTARASRTLATGLRQSVVLLCALLASSGALELHNLANHHHDIEAGQLVDRAASHPGIPHHFDHSDELREPACATCALQARTRGVRPDATGPVSPTGIQRFETPAQAELALAESPSSASPRGPPAA